MEDGEGKYNFNTESINEIFILFYNFFNFWKMSKGFGNVNQSNFNP